jgi:aspartyl-tRNA synthetase
MERIMIKELPSFEGKEVVVKGWVNTIREHGKIIFLEIRDISGNVQSVITTKNKDFELAKELSKESCVQIKGMVNKRPEGTENKNSVAGNVELKIEELKILNKCPPLPFDLENSETSEEIRLKYRYLDLRRPEMQNNLITRAKVITTIRHFFDSNNFNEIETPMLVKSTPGGARNYLVPSRLEAGKFWALPESPQLFKQLLMVAGMERYYQIARCLRDEDLRKDRQPEFTQLDAEMSFINQEDIISLIEKLIQKIWKEVLNVDVKLPFKRMIYADAMKNYGNDRPDLRPETKSSKISKSLSE